MLYRIFPTGQRSMPLVVKPQEFVDEYYNCWGDLQRPTDTLYKQVLPFILHWEEMLREPLYQKDINYVTLCRRLYPTGIDPQELLREWVKHADLNSSVREELELLFFSRLRALKYYPTRATPRMAEYVIAKDFRDRFKDLILHDLRRPIDVPTPGLTFDSLAVEDPHVDHLLLKNLGLDEWDSYMLELLKLGLTTIEVAAITRLPRKTFSREENHLWHQLRMNWQTV